MSKSNKMGVVQLTILTMSEHDGLQDYQCPPNWQRVGTISIISAGDGGRVNAALAWAFASAGCSRPQVGWHGHMPNTPLVVRQLYGQLHLRCIAADRQRGDCHLSPGYGNGAVWRNAQSGTNWLATIGVLWILYRGVNFAARVSPGSSRTSPSRA